MVEDPWTPLKDLANIVEAAVLKNQPGILSDLEISLKKFKPTFIGLLKNPPRSSADASLVRKAATEGISLPLGIASDDVTNKQKLPSAVVEEAMIISEMFEMNEISSLQLLLQGTNLFWLFYIVKDEILTLILWNHLPILDDI